MTYEVEGEAAAAAYDEIFSDSAPSTDKTDAEVLAEMALAEVAPEMLEVMRRACLLLLIRVAQVEKAGVVKNDQTGRTVVDQMVSVIARAEGWL